MMDDTFLNVNFISYSSDSVLFSAVCDAMHLLPTALPSAPQCLHCSRPRAHGFVLSNPKAKYLLPAVSYAVEVAAFPDTGTTCCSTTGKCWHQGKAHQKSRVIDFVYYFCSSFSGLLSSAGTLVSAGLVSSFLFVVVAVAGTLFSSLGTMQL